MPPTAQDIKVATDALRTEAEVWTAQAAELTTIATKADGLRFSRIEAGLFQLICGVHDEIVTHVVARCGEGNTQMTAISSTLRTVADTYDQEESANEHSFRNLY